MTEEYILEDIIEKIQQVEKLGHGEVVIKIKNGYVYRVLTTEDSLIKKEVKNGQ